LTVGLIAECIHNKQKLDKKLGADDLGVESRRSFGLKQTILVKADDHSENLKGEGRSHGLHSITVGVQIESETDSECNWGWGVILVEMK